MIARMLSSRCALLKVGPVLALTLSACGASAAGPGAGDLRLTAGFTTIVTVSATLAFLHLLLFAFETRDRRNLLFALLAAAFTLVAFLDYRERLAAEVVLPGIGPLQRWAVSALILAAVRFAYSFLGDRAPRRFWVYTAMISVLLLVSIPFPRAFALPAGSLGLVVTLDSLVSVIVGHRRVEREAWIVAVGAGLFAVSGLVQMGLDLAGADELGNALAPYLWGGVALLLASSIYLARVFARTRRELERRLVEVEELSASALAQEKAAREQEVRRRLLEAENQRRGRELEEARSLQLAMLPQALPEMPGFELAAGMLTATEVGGDYYDAIAGAGSTLWLAVGDAVGHGARAGSLVAVAKGLFAGVAAQPSPTAALERFDAALRSMDLKRAHLALTVGKLSGRSLEIAAAGMPPVLIRRAGGAVVEIAFSSLPLGSPLGQRYAGRTVELVAGDVVLLLTDGLIELPGEGGAPLGYEAVQRRVARAGEPGDGALGDWVDRFLRDLVEETTPPDDVTLMALLAR